MTFQDSNWAKPLSINIQSNWTVDVQLNWQHTNEVQHWAKMPTCSAVGCENRTSGDEFFRIPAGSHQFQHNKSRLWLQALKQESRNDATPAKEACACSAHFISCKIFSIYQSLVINHFTFFYQKPGMHVKRGTYTAWSYFVADEGSELAISDCNSFWPYVG